MKCRCVFNLQMLFIVFYHKTSRKYIYSFLSDLLNEQNCTISYFKIYIMFETICNMLLFVCNEQKICQYITTYVK